MMQQITVFLENKEGHLSDLTNVLADAGINMTALTVADTSTYGLVRILADNSAAAKSALEAAGYRAALTSILAVEVADEPGGLCKLLKALDTAGINVEYAYCFSLAGGSLAALKVRDLDAAEIAAAEAGFTLR